MAEKLFSGQTEDGVSEVRVFNGSHYLSLHVAGSLGGGTLGIESLAPDGSTWLPVNGVSITEIGRYDIQSSPMKLRLVLSGATGAALNVWMEAGSFLRVYSS